MSILEKAIGLAGAATAGIAAGVALLGGKEKKLAALDLEFSQTTKEYERQRAKFVEKAANGNRGAQRKLEEIERNYNDAKREYEIKRQKYIPKKSKAEEQKELKEMEHAMEMEKLEASHAMEMEKLERTAVPHAGVPNTQSHVSSPGMVCSNCGQVNSNGAKFCCGCGKEIITKRFCSECGAKLTSNSRFCSECGTPIK